MSILLLTIVQIGATSLATAADLTVFAAASLKEAMDQQGRAFEAEQKYGFGLAQ